MIHMRPPASKSHDLKSTREKLGWMDIAFHRNTTFYWQSIKSPSNILYIQQVRGRIPGSIPQLKSSRILAIGQNKFSGAVPDMIYNMSSIEVLSLDGNQLHGNLPQNIGHSLPNLAILYQGQVPASLGNLQRLKRLNLEFNHLGSGQEGDLDFIASLTSCKDLERLALDGNLLGGVLPVSISDLSTNSFLEQIKFMGVFFQA
ncbi:hypothetical protein Sjap_001041 [Stephania japonica]|uniref:Uncharacterized protein n=1 Tax=Stephania japonica TaxID=461633 RepID=A0AAP0KJ82_9MAGN